jgi:hypothetical protein
MHPERKVPGKCKHAMQSRGDSAGTNKAKVLQEKLAKPRKE